MCEEISESEQKAQIQIHTNRVNLSLSSKGNSERTVISTSDAGTTGIHFQESESNTKISNRKINSLKINKFTKSNITKIKNKLNHRTKSKAQYCKTSSR